MAPRGKRRLDDKLIREVIDVLNRVDLRESHIDVAMEPMRTLLRAEATLGFGYQLESGGLAMEWSLASSADRDHPRLLSWFANLPRPAEPWLAFNVLRPEAWQRNRAVQARVLARAYPKQAAKLAEEILPAIGKRGYDQLRVLIYDQGTVLGWVGGLRREPFGLEEVRRLDALVPSLRRRLKWSSAVRRGTTQVSMESVLDALAVPAFVINRRGAIRHGSPAAMALLAHDRVGTSALLHAALHRGGGHGFEIAPLVGPGEGQFFLATCLRAPGLGSHVQEAARRWSLTARQREVLLRLVRGSSNAGIALDLGCSVKTVEAHISAIFEKVQVDRRSALVARVLGAQDS